MKIYLSWKKLSSISIILIIAISGPSYASTGSIETVDSAGGDFSLALDSSDNPQFSYRDERNYDLKYAVMADGSLADTDFSVDELCDVNNTCQLMEPSPPEEQSFSGMLEGTGTYFELNNSEYLNVSVKSSEIITLYLVSVPEMVSMNINSSAASSTVLTLGGYPASTTFYMYEDSHANEHAFTTDTSGNYTYTQDLSQPHHVWIQPTKSTVFIGTNTTLSSDIFDTVEITANDITLDCNGYSIIGSGTGYGIYLNPRTGVTIKNCFVQSFTIGIYLISSSNNTMANNTASNNYHGIRLDTSSNNTMANNTASSNDWVGIYLVSSSNSTITSNTFSNNYYGIRLDYSSNNTITSNTASNSWFGIYLESSSNNNTIANNTASNNEAGIRLDTSSNNTITSNTVSDSGYGIILVSSSNNNTIANNTVSSNNDYGIYLSESSNNAIYLNNFINNFENAISIGSNNVWNSPQPITYTYNCYEYSSKLGNYWSDYTGVDGDNNGIGDTPHPIGTQADNYPLMQPFEAYIQKPPVPGGPYTLEWEGYDYDSKEEVTVTLNGWVVTILPLTSTPGNNNAWATFSFDITPFIVNGANSLTFSQNKYSSASRNILVTDSDGVVIFSDTGPAEVIVQPDRPSITYEFQIPIPGTLSYTLEWEGYDYDSFSEVTVTLNGQVVAILPPTKTPGNNNAWATFSFDITPFVVNGANSLTFSQNKYSSASRNILVTDSNGVVVYSDTGPARTIYSPGRPSTTYTFDLSLTCPPPEPGASYTLEWEGFDYDSVGEVTVTLNGQVVEILPVASSPGNNDVWVTYSFDITPFVVDGVNELTFTQNKYMSASRNILVTDSNGVVVYSDTGPPEVIVQPDRPSTTYIFEI